MNIENDSELIEVLKITGEIYNKQISTAAATMFLIDLQSFSANQIKNALSKCRKELKTFPSVADVISRIEDGRPGVEEAWAMLPKSENDSVVWTDEMCLAFCVCRSLIENDPISARMAFKESYTNAVSNSRSKGLPVRWFPSLGYDKNGRAAALIEAVEKGRIKLEHALSHVPELLDGKDPPKQIEEMEDILKLSGPMMKEFPK